MLDLISIDFIDFRLFLNRFLDILNPKFWLESLKKVSNINDIFEHLCCYYTVEALMTTNRSFC